MSNIKRHINKESIKKIIKTPFMETLCGDKRRKCYTEYRMGRNQIRKLTKRIHKEFEMKLATEAKANPEAVWKYMNSMP